MPLPWSDALWSLSTEQPTFACAPPYIGNGRLGLRLGAFILGTDRNAPRQRGARGDQTFFAVPRFDHTFPLQSYAAHVRDGYLHCLPAWAQLDLRVGRHEFRPGQAITSSRVPLTTSLDLRTGEARLRGDWMVDSGAVAVDIRALIPRSAPHAGIWQLDLDKLDERAEIGFGLDGAHLAGDVEQRYDDVDGDTIGQLRTLGRGRTFVAGLRWYAKGAEVLSDDLNDSGRRVRLRSTGRSVRLTVVFACHGGREDGGRDEVLADLGAVMAGIEDGSLRRDNEGLWQAIWADGPDVTTLPLSEEDRRFVLAQQFYLLASYDESRHPIGPVGLSNNQWLGSQMWDADLWHGRALVALWPRLARRIVRARLDMLTTARAYARDTGYHGARFAWMSDEVGTEVSPDGPYRQELHLNAWAMLLAWDIWRATGDRDFLEESWPLLADVADFWCSRASLDSDGSWHLRGVLGPDEAVHENPANPQVCDDNVTTNLAVRTALRAALDAAIVLGHDAPALWSDVAASLVLLGPDPDGIIPEYNGYTGQTIKQADLILSFFPLELDATPEQVIANVDYYDAKIGSGPLMTEQIAAAIRLRAGLQDKEQILHGLVRAYRRCVHGPFEVPYEVACNSNSLMLTACGGLISALAYGWWDYRRPGDDPALLPRLGAGPEDHDRTARARDVPGIGPSAQSSDPRTEGPTMKISVNNAEPRIDVNGDPIDAHDGALEHFDGLFYWYGTSYADSDGFEKTHRFVVYSSPDLRTWTPHGPILAGAPDGYRYRPYVKRSPATGRYVLWFNWMPEFGDGHIGVGVADRPEGPFVMHDPDVRLTQDGGGDLGLFVDDDGNGYLIFSSHISTTHDVAIERLTPDLLSPTGDWSGVLARGVEAPAMFRRGDTYYALFDTTSCFGPSGSGARVFTANAPLGPYTERGNINRRSTCLPCGGNPTIPAQQAHIARIPTMDGEAYIWMGDRWGSALDGLRAHDHQYWSAPLVFLEDGTIEALRHVNRWDLTLAPAVRHR